MPPRGDAGRRESHSLVPKQCRRALEDLSDEYVHAIGEFGRITQDGCFEYLHGGPDETTRKLLVFDMSQMAASLDQAHIARFNERLQPGTLPAVFSAYYCLYRDGTGVAALKFFKEVLSIGDARAAELPANAEDWAEEQTLKVIRSCSRAIVSWVLCACDRDTDFRGSVSSPIETLGERWLAPKFLFMAPSVFAWEGYDPERLWERLDAGESGFELKRIARAFIQHSENAVKNHAKELRLERVKGNCKPPAEPVQDDWVLCVACGHSKIFHVISDDGACLADLDRTQALWRDSGFGGRCWCSAFASDPVAASLEILKHGDSAALVRGINEAIDRRDLNAAKSLRTRYLRKTPKDQRDDAWLADVGFHISGLSAANEQEEREPEKYVKRNVGDPSIWRGFHDEFEALAKEEYAAARAGTKNECLVAHVSYEDATDEVGDWRVYGNRNERLSSDFESVAARAGLALQPPRGVDPRHYWLRNLFLNLLENRSKCLLFATRPNESGIIQPVCATSAMFCNRLVAESAASLAAQHRENVVESASVTLGEPLGGKRSENSDFSVLETAIEESSKRRRKKKLDLSRYLDGANLTDKQHQCMSLKLEYGLSVSQIAREMNVHRTTVDQHISAAQTKMRSSGQYETVRRRLVEKRRPED